MTITPEFQVIELEGSQRYIIETGPANEPDRFVVENLMLRDGYTSSISAKEVLDARDNRTRFAVLHTEPQRGKAIFPAYLVEYVSYYEDGNFFVNYQTYLSLADARSNAWMVAAFGDATKPVQIREVA